MPANNNNVVVNGQSQRPSPLCATPGGSIEAPPVIKAALHPCTWARPGRRVLTHTPSCVRWHFIEDQRCGGAHASPASLTHEYQAYFISRPRRRAEGGKRALGKYANRSEREQILHTATRCYSHSALWWKIPLPTRKRKSVFVKHVPSANNTGFIRVQISVSIFCW